ncbi:hypothetical protein MUB24_21600 [Lederbergia sp. NSJ-179]|uniref:hypothetical protein n=1 Tax=Lederbergia sp. NSJ-179 TaxID=2931402 RepID=UPI001FD0D557|nr:hypothetical protein [Lederbergia sp. NSJ-179]MCJ7843421.1 hypothetical protein [Lederbergia sp. NSJ-179]
MKKIMVIIASFIIIYSMYHDLTVGVLPALSANSGSREDVEIIQNQDKDMFEKEVRPGDTVISILEENQQDSLPVSIDQIIDDFERLNNGLKPEEIQIGETYRFPIYADKTD